MALCTRFKTKAKRWYRAYKWWSKNVEHEAWRYQ
jgi:predicted deacetylase